MASDILIFNDRYSDNVGDGVIAECLEFGLRSLLPGSSVRTLDLGGRQAMQAGAGGQPWWRRMLRRMAPTRLRRILARHRVQRIFRAQVADAMKSASAVVIGGGQLITGSSTFFAERIAVIAQEARARGVPLHVHAVGVANPDRWCVEAAPLLSHALGGDSCRSVTVRDVASAAHWARSFGSAPPSIARDPALIASDAFFGPHEGLGHRGPDEAHTGVADHAEVGADRARPRRVGVGVIAPEVISFFGDAESAPSTIDTFLDIVRALIARGDRPILFTNGSTEDCDFLSNLCNALASQVPGWRDQVEVADRPRSAAQLVRCIRGMDAVVAHRLHANIIAYALGIPNVALAWDAKLRAFQRSIGREDYLVTGTGAQPVAAAVSARLAEAAAAGVNAASHGCHVEEAWDAIANLAKCIVSSADLGTAPMTVMTAEPGSSLRPRPDAPSAAFPASATA